MKTIRRHLITLSLLTACMGAAIHAQNIDTLPPITGAAVDKTLDKIFLRDASIPANAGALRGMPIGEIVNVPGLFGTGVAGALMKPTGSNGAVQLVGDPQILAGFKNPTVNNEITFEKPDDSLVRVKLQGSDGIVRSSDLRLFSGPKKSLVFLGDSISDPNYNLGNDTWVRVFARKYQPLMGASVAELAVVGITAQTVAGDINTRLAAFSADNNAIAFLLFGTNDIGAGRTQAQIVADIKTISDACKAKGFKVCVISPPLRTMSNGVALGAKNLLAAATWPDYFVDLFGLDYQNDGYVHPTADGAIQIARLVSSTLLGSGHSQGAAKKIKITGKIVKPITAITAGNPAQVTCANHGFTTGDLIDISGVTGAAVSGQPGWGNTIERPWVVTVTSVNTFTIPAQTTSAGSGGNATGGVIKLKTGLSVNQTVTYMLHTNSVPNTETGKASYLGTAFYDSGSRGAFPLLKISESGNYGPVLTGRYLYIGDSELYIYNQTTNTYLITALEMLSSSDYEIY